ncbi:flagellar basal body-associated FliL family protein [Alkalibacterium olivapovliticus]|uniref:Flagellar protein FliL n=1 Tax=Alkalibacterium olivapovliticus TaxID=99907 RepID=A0A2T0VYU5_9LACT|nr:flagellar basal body-associated FliL family protein [Alkalibacterium olivapovliticus]PRY77512.1 flagellar FliL protein [Alkalibacterium olivapovliticus]
MAQNEEKGKNKKATKVAIAIVLAVVVLVVGMGIGITVFGSPNEESFLSRFTEKAEAEASEISIPLEEFLVNVNGDTSRSQAIVRMQLTLTSLDEDAAELITEDIAKVRDAVIHVISSQSADSILEETDGEFSIKDKIRERINQSLSEELIEDVFVTDILIQR